MFVGMFHTRSSATSRQHNAEIRVEKQEPAYLTALVCVCIVAVDYRERAIYIQSRLDTGLDYLLYKPAGKVVVE